MLATLHRRPRASSVLCGCRQAAAVLLLLLAAFTTQASAAGAAARLRGIKFFPDLATLGSVLSAYQTSDKFVFPSSSSAQNAPAPDTSSSSGMPPAMTMTMGMSMPPMSMPPMMMMPPMSMPSMQSLMPAGAPPLVSTTTTQGTQYRDGYTVSGPTCDGTPFVLSCANTPGTVITVADAFYGRDDSNICPFPGGAWAQANTACTYPTALLEAAWQCKGLKTCTPVFFNGDPCVGTYKYSVAAYVCAPPPAKQYTVGPACDGAPFTLSCPAGSTITNIIGSFFGRSDTTTCPYPSPAAMANAACILPTSGWEMAPQCYGRNSCTPTFSADPCPGTFKWKTVTYTCS